MIATALGSVEVLSFNPQSPRADQVLASLARSALMAGVRVSTSHTYVGGSDLMVLWGPGHPARVEPMRQQLAAGGHCACFDLSYWNRDRKARVSIDAAHPQAWVMRRDWPASRLQADGIVTRNDWHPNGPVIVVGIGEKAKAQYGNQVALWEAAMMADGRRRGKTMHYRPKRGASVPIDQALKGASLVLTWHSNVAVDAIRLGIPVVCQDGAAAAVCPSTWEDDPQPLPTELRARFLQNLAYFQWDMRQEAGQCVDFLQELLS